MQKILVATRLDAQTHAVLRDLAGKKDRTICYLVRKAVEQFIEGEKKAEKRGRQAA